VTACGIGFLLRPQVLAVRFAATATDRLSEHGAIEVASGVATSITLLGIILFAVARRASSTSLWRLTMAASAITYVAFARPLSDWIIDDAAITFAYSENLVAGHGLRLHPDLDPEESYSNTLWMLWLAACRFLGMQIPATAKYSCIAIGVAVVIALHSACTRLTRQHAGTPHQPGAATLAEAGVTLAPFAVLLTAPFLVWSTSGLEHTLQALCILSMVTAPLTPRLQTSLSVLASCTLVLIRPEAPLLVAATFTVHSLEVGRAHGILTGIRKCLPLALYPALAWIGLMVFRLSYFGDPFPNPYYAKAAGATFARVVNVFGGGWDYVFTWLLGSGVFVAAFAVLRATSLRSTPLSIRLGLAVTAAHLAFVVYAGGDWMGCWRFLAPVIPTIALMVGWSYHVTLAAPGDGVGDSSARYRTGMAWLTVSVLWLATTKQFLAFVAAPTTPFSVVAHIGSRFTELSGRLGIKSPVLAHHDAGGTSFQSGVRLLDLGGLGSRTIAKHWSDADFICRYVLEEVAPDFIFGVKSQFAAGRSLFWQRREFLEDYVPLEFAADPLMQADLCHVRRQLLDNVPSQAGLELSRADGKLVKVVVTR
jgi:hypothetical protein